MSRNLEKEKQVAELLDSVGTRFFSVDYIKDDGTPRKLTGLSRVKKDLKGGERSWDPESKGKRFVWDRNADPKRGRYRTLTLSTVTELRINGKKYTWDT